MLNESYTNVFFGLTTILMLLASIQHSAYISNNVAVSEEYYFGANIGIIITCIFANICLGIFGLFILGNLSDFIQKMTVNLIGAKQKLRVLAVLLFTNFLVFTGSNLVCFLKAIKIFGVVKKMAIVGFSVSVLQVVELFAISLIHGDVFGLRKIQEMKEYDTGRRSATHYV